MVATGASSVSAFFAIVLKKNSGIVYRKSGGKAMARHTAIVYIPVMRSDHHKRLLRVRPFLLALDVVAFTVCVAGIVAIAGKPGLPIRLRDENHVVSIAGVDDILLARLVSPGNPFSASMNKPCPAWRRSNSSSTPNGSEIRWRWSCRVPGSAHRGRYSSSILQHGLPDHRHPCERSLLRRRTGCAAAPS